MTTENRSLPTEWAEPAQVTHEADEKQLLLLMKDWRKGRATRSLLDVLQDGYVALFALVMVGAMVINVIIKAQQVASDCSTQACTSGRGLLPWAALAGVLAMAMAAARLFGPVLASAAEGFWLMEAPLHRDRLLRRRLWTAVGLALVAGAVLGALVAALTGSPLRAILAWTGATGLGAAGLVAFAAAEQGAERTVFVRAVQGLAGFAGLVALLLVVSTATGWRTFQVDQDTTIRLATVVAGLGAVLAVAGLAIALHRLWRIPRARLMSGGSLVQGMQGAAFALDFGLMRDILVERQAMARGSVRPTRGRGLGLQALVWRDVQRLVRFPRPLLTLAASAVVPYAVQALGLGSMNVIISALVLMAALVPLFGSLRVLSRTKGLSRCLPYGTAQIRQAATIVPSVLAGTWWVAVTPAFVGLGAETRRDPQVAVMLALVTAVAGLVAAIRWVSAKPADYNSPMLSTSMGAMPPGLMFNLFRGFDMVALISLPVLLGGSPWISLVLAFIAWTFLRMGGLNQAEMLEQQAEQRRMLEEAKAQARAEREAKKK